ncbi:MAG: serine hydrolase domain-containing protein [Bacteroidota bacterium]
MFSPQIMTCLPLIYLLSSFGLTYAQTPVSKLDQYFQHMLLEGAAPGFSVAVVQGNQVVFEKGYGLTQIGTSTPMTAKHVLPVGSLTKSFTALAVMQLVEAGKLNLDRSVVADLPWFQTANPIRSNRITPRMLLNNSSGLYGGELRNDLPADAATRYLIESLSSQQLERDPGQLYDYSNTGFALAGYLVHHASQQPYAEYLQAHVFHPLGMESTSCVPRKFSSLPSLDGHYLGEKEAIPATREARTEPLAFAPAGSVLRSSAHDLAKYLTFLVNPDSFPLIQAESFSEMLRPQSCFPGLSYLDGGEDESIGYGLGWMLSEIEGRTLIFHGGSTGTTSSFLMWEPARKLGVVLLFNLDYTFVNRYEYPSHTQIANNVLHLMAGETTTDFGSPRKADPTLNAYQLPQESWSHYTGSYELTMESPHEIIYYGLELRLRPGSDSGLTIEAFRGEQLIAQSQLDFVSPGAAIRRSQASPEAIRFILNAQGSVTGVTAFGATFAKTDQRQQLATQRVKSPDGHWEIHLLRQVSYQWAEHELLAADPGKFQLKLGIRSADDPGPINQGQLALQSLQLGRFTWRQWTSRSADTQHLHLSCFAQGQIIQVQWSCPEGELTRSASQSLYPILQSLKLR